MTQEEEKEKKIKEGAGVVVAREAVDHHLLHLLSHFDFQGRPGRRGQCRSRMTTHRPSARAWWTTAVLSCRVGAGCRRNPWW